MSQPGGIPPKGSTVLEYHWACLACPETGSGRESNKDAERHQRAATHPTRVWAVPVHEPPPDTV